LIRQLAKVEQWQENAGDTKRMGLLQELCLMHPL